MIRLTRLNRALIVLNSDLIEHIDVTPDTVITLTTGQILRVRESAEHTNAVWISWVALSTAVLAAQFVMSHM